MEEPQVIINGVAGSAISTMDRGLLYGDGLFETMVVKKGSIRFWQSHLSRLQSGCSRLNINCPDEEILINDIESVIRTDETCVIKLIITRGEGERGYKPTDGKSTRIVQKFSMHDYPSEYYSLGVNVTLCNFRISHQPKLAGIKHLNRLEQVLARGEWGDEYQEGIVCDSRSNVIEATSSNVIFEADQKLYTPDLSLAGIEGVMRKEIIQHCNNNKIDIRIQDISLDQVKNFNGMLLCNSAIGIWPVKQFDAQQFEKTAIIDSLMSVFN